MGRIHLYHEGAGDRIAELIRARAPDLDVVLLTDRESFERALGEVEVLFAAIPPTGLWAGAMRLKLIQLMGVGADLLLPAPDLPDGVRVCGLRGVQAPEASEHAIAMMLALARALPTAFARQRQRVWRQYAVESLSGARLCVLGLGAIGGRVAKIASAMGMCVRGVRRRPRPTDHVEEVFGPDALAEALDGVDYVVVTLPLTRRTRALIDAEALARLPRGARLVQLGRGGVVDEGALLDALRQGALGGAALDVFAHEPLPEDSPLWDAPNLIVTPHHAGLGRRYVERAVDVLLDNLARLEAGQPLRGIVDLEAGY